jgi:kynurenine formamidase
MRRTKQITGTTNDLTHVLSTNHYQIELLTNLDQVPEAGAIVVASFPKPKGGSGFPAQVFEIFP